MADRRHRSSKRAQLTPVERVDLDLESYSELDLRKVGAHIYWKHPSTRVHCLSFIVNGGTARTWTPDQPVPSCLRATPKKVGAFQAEFEFLALQALRRRYPDFADIPFSHFDDARVRAKVLALPAKLETVGAALGLTNSTPAGSQRLVLSMARTPDAPPEKLAQLIERCTADTKMEMELHDKLPELTRETWEQWQLCHLINHQNGIPICLDLAHAARYFLQQLIPEANAKISKATNGEITSVNQVGRLLPYVREHGYRGRSLRKQTVEQHFDETDEDGQELLTLRRDAGSAAFRKIDTIIARTDVVDSRAYGSLDFSKAGTGRDSSSGVQFQNMKRISSSDHIEEAIAIVLSRNLKRLRDSRRRPSRPSAALSDR